VAVRTFDGRVRPGRILGELDLGNGWRDHLMAMATVIASLVPAGARGSGFRQPRISLMICTHRPSRCAAPFRWDTAAAG
jgi:hypothetical protein